MDELTTDMAGNVKLVYQRGYNALYNEVNPFTRANKQFYWWQAGFFDSWGEMPEEAE